MEELSQLLVLAAEQLQQNGDDRGCGDDVLTSHDFETGDERAAHHGVQDREILLEQVDHFSRQERGDLLTVDARNVSHELEVVDELLVLFGGVFLEFLQFFNENVQVCLELPFVKVTLPLDLVL